MLWNNSHEADRRYVKKKVICFPNFSPQRCAHSCGDARSLDGHVGQEDRHA